MSVMHKDLFHFTQNLLKVFAELLNALSPPSPEISAWCHLVASHVNESRPDLISDHRSGEG